MNTNEINYNDVDTFPKFARVTVRILIEILKTLMKKNEAPILMVGGKHIYLQAACDENLRIRAKEGTSA